MASNLRSISTLAELNAFQQSSASAGARVIALGFWTRWSEPSLSMLEILATLSKQSQLSTALSVAKVEAEEAAELSEKFGIDSVPTTTFLVDGKVVDTVKGANPPELTTKAQALVTKYSTDGASSAPATSNAPAAAESEEALRARIEALLKSAKVMAFIKGTPAAPQCGFSRRFVELLKREKITFGSFNILSDPAVREGLKKYSNWPTYPQLYINGELVGGLDVCTELAESGELRSMIPSDYLSE